MVGPYILCVDDEALIVESVRQELRRSIPGATIETALSGAEALSLLEEIERQGEALAVLITDERMPGMRGHELLRLVRERHPHAYGILLTGYADIDAIQGAVNEAGLFRLMQKPWNRTDLAIAVRRALDLFEREREVAALRIRVEKLNLAIVAALENPAHESDPEFFKHLQQVACFAAIIGRRLGLPEIEVRKLFIYAPLHDLGKYTVPSAILNKPGKLTPEEFGIMKEHVTAGARVIETVDIDPFARDIILYHHEHWNGKGYLEGLAGTEIPVAGRIVGLADVLSAVLQKRPYKDAVPYDQVAAELIRASGSHFDPDVVDAFLAEREACRLISMDRIPPEFDFALHR